MTLTLTSGDWDDLRWQEVVTCPKNLVLENFESLTGVPESIGCGYCRDVELSPGVELSFSESQYHQDVRLAAPAHDHPIQISVFLSGYIDCDIHPTLGGDLSYFSGSGVSPAYGEIQSGGQPLTCLNLEIDPAVMRSFLADDHGQSEGLQQLFRGEDWKASFYPKVTPAVRSLVHQMWHAPYRGVVKRLYLQAKVFELLALHLDLISDSASQPQSGSGLKPDTVARLHYAKEILANQLENPPLLSELAQMVGVSDRTLQRGFKSLFHTTVVGYLKQQRLYQAERLLRQGHCTVADVATRVGYGHLGRFAAEFKQQFGITPKACLVGKRGDG
ncbi:helix-turn-helix transcriptional regulator [Leptothoe sp. PORK10 BA2]|uniref:helix-turn-helix transcriptional regulator n=1 Tax=Leptothoe sp. PORK10 BA2 TaxID=3110254 RepID=UPI002B1EBD4C|nr:AraC family transcriptional regulator [Leptothoe sp. PORK10 BA2]MEA5466686.1 AraC family transcriptional regulator [Leptothoe sp. PORK10 BA2]